MKRGRLIQTFRPNRAIFRRKSFLFRGLPHAAHCRAAKDARSTRGLEELLNPLHRCFLAPCSQNRAFLFARNFRCYNEIRSIAREKFGIEDM